MLPQVLPQRSTDKQEVSCYTMLRPLTTQLVMQIMSGLLNHMHANQPMCGG
jgi:hypothetical protein